MTSCMELWFPTSAPASHRRHFFLLRSLSLALFLLISSRIVLLFFFIFYFYFFFYTYRGVIMRQRWSNFVASRLLRNWSRRTTLQPPSRSVIFKNYCSLRVLSMQRYKSEIHDFCSLCSLTILRLFHFSFLYFFVFFWRFVVIDSIL